MFALCGWGASGANAQTFEAGTAHRGVFDLAGKQVVLPDGEWILAGHGYDPVPDLDDVAYGAIENVVLFRLDGSAVAAFVIAQRNVIGIEDGWGTAPECSRGDLLGAVIYDGDAGHGFCGFVTHVLSGFETDAASSWRAAAAYAAEHGLTMPATWLLAGFRIADLSDLLDVRYHFNPELQGQPAAPPSSWQDSPWARPRVFEDSGGMGFWSDVADLADTMAFWRPPEPVREPPTSAAATGRAELANDLKEWLSVMRFPVNQGFDNRADAVSAVPMPWPAAAYTRLRPELTFRLSLLDELAAEGAISPGAYEAQTATARRMSAAAAERQWTAGELTAVKALTDQVSGAVSYFVADYLYTGQILQATTIWAADQALDAVRYTTLEYGWQRFGPRRLGVNVVSLRGAGIDGS